MNNTSCMVHEHIRAGRDDRVEAREATHHLSVLKDYQPPCSRDIAVFSPLGWTITHHDPLAWRKLPPVHEDLPPYSFCTSPYGRMFSKEKGVTWENDPEEQRNTLRDYFDRLEKGKSLVFFYANHGNPLTEEKYKRVLVGVARIKEIGEQIYFPTTPKYNEQHPVWSRRITIDHPIQSFRLPYQEYASLGLDTEDILCLVPESVREEFSYVSEHLSDDQAVIVLEELVNAVKRLAQFGKIPGDWQSRLMWLNGALSQCWRNRGYYPGIGSVLEHLGARRGTTYQRQVLVPMSQKQDPWAHVQQILDGQNPPEKDFKRDLETAKSSWIGLTKPRRELLRTLSLFELSKEQIDRVGNSQSRQEAGISAEDKQLLENPYRLCEMDEGGPDSPPIGFEQIDHGLVPESEPPENWEDISIVSPNDARRIRALLSDVLRSASDRGDTVLSLTEALSRVRRRIPSERSCNPDPELIMGLRDFYENQFEISTDPSNNSSLVALRTFRRMETEVANSVQQLVKSPIVERKEIDWDKKLGEALGPVGFTRLEADLEALARKEKVAALKQLYSRRFSILTGRAGTGKTLVAKILLGVLKEEGEDLLLLAPTGKARVRLQEMTGIPARTIHQFLNENNWLKKIGDGVYSYQEKGGKKTGSSTVLVDESSMVPLDLLATLLRAMDLNQVKRFILVGDPNQLAPIGPGRPFVDIITWTDEQDLPIRSCHANLRERVRQEKRNSEGLRLSDGYATEAPMANDDEILSNIATGYNGGDLEVHFWNDAEGLFATLDGAMKRLLGIQDSEDSYLSFNQSLGIDDGHNRSPESWQILSPARMHEYGTSEINRRIQEKFHRGIIEDARHRYDYARPFGDEQIVWKDKIIQVTNGPRSGHNASKQKVNGYVANGEIGFVRNTSKGPRKSQDSLSVEFSSQPGIGYAYYRPQIDDNLELAYAITVHKAQGSDFDLVFLIVPQRSQTLSREMFYTALTRFRKRLVLLVERDIENLRKFRSLAWSETALRNTNMFTVIVRPDDVDVPYPEKLVHRTKTNVLVRSKSELVVANILTDLGISYEYEKPLEFAPSDFRLPDFTIRYQGKVFYWEHLGMLALPSYREDWIRKKSWYGSHGLLDQVITSEEDPEGGIDSLKIQQIATDKIL
jgi:exodeoxyribonuclease V alpha subunit